MPMFEGTDRKEVLNRMGGAGHQGCGQKPVVYGVVFGSSLDAAAREELPTGSRRASSIHRPRGDSVPRYRCGGSKTGEMSPRKCDFACLCGHRQNTHVWYSGLTRYSSVPSQMIVNSSQGGGFKDTWVLAPQIRRGA